MLRAFYKVPCLLRVAKMELKLISTVKTTNKLKGTDSSHFEEKPSSIIFNLLAHYNNQIQL